MRFIRRSHAREVIRRCSFCGKKMEQVARLITGPGVSICDECVDLCRKILEAETPTS